MSPIEEPPVRAEGEDLAEQPGPTSRLVEGAAPPRQTPARVLADRLALVSRSERVVVVGRVVALRAERRALRNAEAAITTRATIALTEQLCGDRVGSTVELVYAGGRIDATTAEYTSQMPRDLEPGTSHVFVLRRAAGELVLEMGAEDLLRAHGSSIVMPGRGAITAAEVKEACR